MELAVPVIGPLPGNREGPGRADDAHPLEHERRTARPVAWIDPFRHGLEGGVGVELRVDPRPGQVPDPHCLHGADAFPDEGDLVGVQSLPGCSRVERSLFPRRLLEVAQELVRVHVPSFGDRIGKTEVLVLREVTVGEVLASQVVQHGDAHGVRDLVLGGLGQRAQGIGCRCRAPPRRGRGTLVAEVAGTGEEAHVRVLRRDRPVRRARHGV